MERRKEYAAVDLFKMFCAILVMMIHTKPFENNFWIDAGIGMVTRFAVPFFFTVSGYFLFQKISQQPEKRKEIVIHYLLRLFRFYLIWFVAFRILDAILAGHFSSIWYYIKQFFFTTDGSPLWFVNALIWATVLVYVMTLWLRKSIVFIMGIAFLGVGYCLSTLLGITGGSRIVNTIKPVIDFIGIQNGLFFAFTYVAMGALLTEKSLKTETKKNLIFVLVFFICLGAESLIAVLKLKAPFTFLWLSAVPMTWFTAKLILSFEMKSQPIHYTIRKISTLFYVLHVVVFKVLQRLFAVSQISQIDSMNMILTICTLAITFGISYGFFLLSKKNKLQWLKYAM